MEIKQVQANSVGFRIEAQVKMTIKKPQKGCSTNRVGQRMEKPKADNSS